MNNISTNYLNQISVNQHLSAVKPRLSGGGTGKKIKKNISNSSNANPMANSSNLSMVLVMNNMVHGQKGGSHHGRKNVLAKNLQKRGNSSTNTPGTQYHNKGNQRVQNEFYF